MADTYTAGLDGDAVRELARHAHALAEPIEVRYADPDTPAALYQIVPNGYAVQRIDLSDYAPRPNRKTGRTQLTDTDSFVRYVQRHALPGTTLYAIESRGLITAVLNDDTATEPGWGDHTAELHLTRTPEWLRWSEVSGKWQQQIDFAEFVEDHLHVFETPTGAHMMELAQTFEATTSVDFESGARLDNGQRQLVYKETVGARAGQAGSLEVPAKLRIGLVPFKGGPGYRLDVHLRYRINGGDLQLMVKLDRPDEVLENAFGDTVARIEDALTSIPDLMLVHSRNV